MTAPTNPITYSVCAYIGDYPMENQPNWGQDYPTVFIAAVEAVCRWGWLGSELIQRNLDPYATECCVVVTHGDGVGDPDFVIGRPGQQLGCHWD